MSRPTHPDGSYMFGHEREHVPLTENRAVGYPKLECGATMGTVCESRKDDWTWIIITDIPEKTWGEVFDEDDDRADERVVRFLILDKLTDDQFTLFEDCVGCYEHVKIARMYTDTEGAGNFVRISDFSEKFRPLGPLHPNARTKGGRSE